jgi:hypothetical protein
MNNVKLNIELSYTKLKERFLEKRKRVTVLNYNYIYYYYYYYCILHLSAERYKELLAIRLGKPLIDKNPRRASFASFLCSPLLINNSRYYHMLYPL